MRPDDSADRSTSSRIAALLTLVLLSASVLGLATTVLDPVVAVGAVAVLVGFALFRRWRWAVPSPRSPPDDGPSERTREDDASSVWNAIPTWQYDGRHVEAGGMTRGEQEQAVREIHQRADELTEEPRRQ
ncbi:hypothetical protein [Natrinema marinum]|uniref:hypothetical protein n=1 Tax=Natrinema marinum TaxID=2961598 RepID=UPI0020C85880|nr:hypothetical protein [Natrinema marinum]